MVSDQDYEQFVKEGTVHVDHVYPFLGLAGEAGEAVDYFKKLYRNYGATFHAHMSPEAHEELLKELGDVLWYLTRIVMNMGYDLETVKKINMRKLRARRGKTKVRS